MQVLVIGTGVANTASVLAALKRVGADPRLSVDPAEVAAAERVVLPGVGSFASGMARLREAGLVEVLAGLGRDELAIQLAGEVLAFDDSRGTRALLFERLLRAGNDAVRTTLEERLAR